MGLLIKPPSWGYFATNLAAMTASQAVTTIGTAVTAGANNADGTAVSAMGPLTHDVEYITIEISTFLISAGNGATLLSLLVDPAGGTSWSTLIASLNAGGTPLISTTTNFSRQYHFPLWIKAGSTLGLQARTAHSATLTGQVLIKCYGGNKNPGSWWAGQKVTSYAITAAASTGTNHTPGASGAFSTWTNLGATLAHDASAFQFGIGGTNSNVTASSRALHFEFGFSSVRVGPPVYFNTGTAEQGFMMQQGPLFYSAPVGAQMMVRGVSSGTAQDIDVCYYAVH